MLGIIVLSPSILYKEIKAEAHIPYVSKLKEVNEMNWWREGLFPTLVGSCVTAAGYALRRSRFRPYANAVIGFGLAHVVLGTIDLIEHRSARFGIGQS
jgi:hypothetical protein